MLYRIVRVILWLYFKVVYRFEIVNIENLPNEGPYMICSNHKIRIGTQYLYQVL